MVDYLSLGLEQKPPEFKHTILTFRISYSGRSSHFFWCQILFFFPWDSSQHCIWSTHLIAHRKPFLLRQCAGKLGLVLLEIGHMKCHFNVEQVQWTGSYNKSFHSEDYLLILFIEIGPHHGNWTLFRLHQLAPSCYCFGFLVFSRKKATQEHKAGRLAGTEQL